MAIFYKKHTNISPAWWAGEQGLWVIKYYETRHKFKLVTW